MIGDLGRADETTTDDRSGGGGGKTGGLTFRIDLEVIGQCSPSLTASVGPPKGRCMIVNTYSPSNLKINVLQYFNK